MATITPAPPPVQAPERGRSEVAPAVKQETPESGRLHFLNHEYVLVLPAGIRIAASALNFLFFSVFALLWLTFGALLILNQSALNTVWQHLIDLPVALQVVVWIVFLPLTVGLWIWESDWTLWLRLTLVIIVGVGWTAAMFPGPSAKTERESP